MSLLPLVISASTAIGLGYFGVDLYRNRRRLSEKPVPDVDLTCYEVGMLDRGDIPTVGNAVGHVGHSVAEASSECMGGSIGHCVEAIAHAISHH